MICQACRLPEAEATRKCSTCGEGYCANCCKTVVGTSLLCNVCVGHTVTDAGLPKEAQLLLDEVPARYDHPEWFLPTDKPVENGQYLPAAVSGVARAQVAPSLASIMNGLKSSDIRKQMDGLRSELAGLKVLLRVAEARERKPRKPRKKKEAKT